MKDDTDNTLLCRPAPLLGSSRCGPTNRPWRGAVLRTLDAMGHSGITRLVAVAILVVAASGCSGVTDTAAGAAAQQLADALTIPDAAALKILVEDDTSAGRTDLLVAEVVADNAVAGKQVEIAADVSRINGFGTFTITSRDVPGLRLPVANRLTKTRTPGALRTVDIRADRELSVLTVNGHPVPVDPVVPAGKQGKFDLPPGEWSLALPSHPMLESTPQTVTLLDRPEPDGVALTSRINEAGETEARRQADAAIAACEKPTTDPTSGCGGTLELCAGARTTRTVTFSERPVWTVDETRIEARNTLRRTVSTVCTDRTSGEVVDRVSSSGGAELSGDITWTTTGLTVGIG